LPGMYRHVSGMYMYMHMYVSVYACDVSVCACMHVPVLNA